MRNKKGQFIKGHKVFKKWKEKWSQERKGVPNPKNAYPRNKKQVEFLRTINLGRIPWNKGKGKQKFNCEVCRKEVFDKPYRRKRFCSRKCKNLYSHLMKGENHWNYKGENNNLQRCWSEYKEWHRKILKRDNYTCQKCKQRGGKLVAHHIKSWAQYPELRFAIDNGITFCEKCHKEFHKIYGKKNNNKEQIENFIKKD